MYAYCFNNPVNLDDSSGNWPKWIKNIANTITKTVKKAISAINRVVNAVPLVNHVNKAHVTTPKVMLDGGIFLGKVGFSSTVTKQDKELGLAHSYLDSGNDASSVAIGVNVGGWLGADIGVSSEINAFASAQVTPWLHGKASVGIDGLGVAIGFDIGDISHDFEINCGWGLVAIFVFPQIVTSSGQTSSAPA